MGIVVSNCAVKPTRLRRAAYFRSLALAHGGVYSTFVKNRVLLLLVFPKSVFSLVFWLGALGLVVALVQVRFPGYAVGFGWPLCGLRF